MLNTKWTIFQLYNDGNKIHFDMIMIMSVLF